MSDCLCVEREGSLGRSMVGGVSRSVLGSVVGSLGVVGPRLVLRTFASPVTQRTLGGIVRGSLPGHRGIVLEARRRVSCTLSRVIKLKMVRRVVGSPSIASVDCGKARLVIGAGGRGCICSRKVDRGCVVGLVRGFTGTMKGRFAPGGPVLSTSLGGLHVGTIRGDLSPFNAAVTLHSSGTRTMLGRKGFGGFTPRCVLRFFRTTVGSHYGVVVTKRAKAKGARLRGFLIECVSFRRGVIGVRSALSDCLGRLCPSGSVRD